MPLDDRTRVGLVGINDRARRLLLPGLAGSPRARVTAVCSRDPAKARQTAAGLGRHVYAFTQIEAMAGSGAVDSVFVNTPVETHFDLCLATIRARCAVICEKPLAANTGQAVALQQAAAEA
ncbi:MAG: Gfo/Idh/MocA family protein, partial [Chloroflexota bacterium]